jgi:hypothetical protein
MFELFGIGKAWEGAFRKEASSGQQGIVADSPISATALKVNSAQGTSDSTRSRFQAASDALRSAFGGFARETRPTYATTISETRSTAAFTSGVSARVDPFDVNYQVLQTTTRINTQTDTSRASTAAIGLDTTSPEAVSRIGSTAEMNTGVTTSYGSSSLTFKSGSNTSSSDGTLTGTYTGVNTAAAATSLTVKITKGGTLGGGLLGLGTAAIKFEVADQTGTVLFRFDGTLGSGDKVYLGDDIGLSLAFSSGDLKNNHTSSTTVTKTPITVNANATFNASAALRPKFDNGAQVTAGSFKINGTSIAVAANDSITSVLSRINSSGAGVTASVSGDKISLVTNANSEDAIVLANDTTGFLAATKLSAAATTVGNVRDDRQALSKTSQFGTVTTGSFTVNGISISVNKDSDTLSTVISRINSSGADVTASYDSATDKLVFTPNVAGATLSIDDDTSGFLAAAKVATGTIGTAFNPDAAFDGKGGSTPMFDAGQSVKAGSFSVNGVAISVAKNDTVNKVLAKITASAAGVTAAYDSVTQHITLTSKEGGTGPITVGGDTSGFLAAVKLDGTAANSVSTVAYSSFTSALGEMSEYAGVTAGTLTVNGQNIAIDPATTTLRGLVTALNGLTGVAARVNETNGGIDVWSESAGASVTLADTSGILAALGLSPGTVAGTTGRSSSVTTRTGSSTTSNSIDVAAKAAAAITQLNEAFGGLANEELTEALETLVGQLRDNGIRGLNVTNDGDEVGLSISQDQLVNALNALNDEEVLAKALASTFDRFSANVASAAGWDAPAPAAVQTLTLAGTSRAQLLADQTATSLLFLRSSLQPQESEDSAQKAAMKAYGESV